MNPTPPSPLSAAGDADAIADADAFVARWHAPHNFLMTEVAGFLRFDFPPLATMIDRLRQDEKAAIGPGTVGDALLASADPTPFRELPIDVALERPFSIAHYQLTRFYGAGDILDGFEEQVMVPWRQFLADLGFTWHRCYPIIFVSGRGCATNYHVDQSHVLAWQVAGTKEFCSLREPSRWMPLDDVSTVGVPGGIRQPPELTATDTVVHVMPPGAKLWNALLTPHWVKAGGSVAFSVNISHGGLRYRGKLAPNDALLHAWYRHQPERWF